ncbi:hypothetical protein NIES267_35950 [Calothrix parasitica NIES-267]|uniref:Uncharacterized protein n=1 Tax=Calothrix parasitica NIES-267 TaxID=1973488 RepID=A0A1Z4LS82_9CYAN|nr:hypothetical protein NIES267_35950 [Calothrix parasitica NIES-267]
MKHKIYLEKYDGSLEELAEDIGNLRYDALAEFLKLLSDKINKDSESDLSRNRVKLAACLKECSLELNQASIAIDKAWEICEPYCQEESS